MSNKDKVVIIVCAVATVAGLAFSAKKIWDKQQELIDVQKAHYELLKKKLGVTDNLPIK